MRAVKLLMWLARWGLNLLFLTLLLVLLASLAAPRWLNLEFRLVASSSMSPTIPAGSIVALQPVEIDDLFPQDVITFRSPEVPDLVVTHRIVEVRPYGDGRAFLTQGDANAEPDLLLLPAERVIGRVSFHVPYLGYLAGYLRTRQGWLLLVLLPAGAIVLLELWNIIKTIWATGTRLGARS